VRMLVYILSLFLVVVPARAQQGPVCTPERIAELETELEGIRELRKMGLAQFRGACTVIQSMEKYASQFGGPILEWTDAALKRLNINMPANAFSGFCKHVHKFVDDVAVGERERVVKEELQKCRKPSP